jgi:predicted metal-dependent peptidase
MPTACQGFSSRGDVLITVNPDFLVTLKQEQRLALLIHELRHALHLHVLRCGTRDPLLFNVASDTICNADPFIKSQPIMGMVTIDSLPLSEVDKNTFREQEAAGNLLAEEVYSKLLVKVQEMQKQYGPGGSQDFSGNLDLDPNAGDEDGEGGSGALSEAAIEGAKAKLRQMVQDAQSKSIGHLPGDLGEILKQLRPPQVAWPQKIRTWSSSVLGIGRIRSYRRPPRIPQDAYVAPGRSRSEGKRVLVMIDASGSVPTKSLECFFGEIEALEGYADVFYTVFDAASSPVKEYMKGDWHKIPLSRGGTDVREAFKRIPEAWPIDGIVVLTDGYTPWPEGKEIPKVPTLWAITTDVTAPFGVTVRLEDAN